MFREGRSRCRPAQDYEYDPVRRIYRYVRLLTKIVRPGRQLRILDMLNNRKYTKSRPLQIIFANLHSHASERLSRSCTVDRNSA